MPCTNCKPVMCAASQPPSPSQPALAEAQKDVSLLAMTMDRLAQVPGTTHPKSRATPHPSAQCDTSIAPARIAQAGRPLEPINRIIVLGKRAEGVNVETFVSTHEQTVGKDVTGLLLLLPGGASQQRPAHTARTLALHTLHTLHTPHTPHTLHTLHTHTACAPSGASPAPAKTFLPRLGPCLYALRCHGSRRLRRDCGGTFGCVAERLAYAL